MWKQSDFSIGNANQKRIYGKLKSLGIILLLLISSSIVFIKPGLTQTPSVAFKVEPTYIAGKTPDRFDVQFNVYGANYDDLTDVHTWSIDLYWTPSVLECDLLAFKWGDFLEGPRFGSFGLLLLDATAGATDVWISDGSVYQAGYTVFIKDDSNSETNTIISVDGSLLSLATPLAHTYTVAANAGAYPDPLTQPSIFMDQGFGNLYMGITTLGPAAGASGDGWLATARFVVQQNANTVLNIDGSFTYIFNRIGETIGDEPGELSKESGYFLNWQPVTPVGDALPDGLIDVFDIYAIGKNWLKYPLQWRIPTTTSGAWTNGANAYMTDDLRAYTASAGSQVYGGFGFATGLWPGVSKVEVGVERRASVTIPYDDILRIEVSMDGGSNWSPTLNNTVISWGGDRFEWIDFTAAYSWTPAGVANIAVRITYVKVGGGGTHSTIQVDWVTVRVTPTSASSHRYADASGDTQVTSADFALAVANYGHSYRP